MPTDNSAIGNLFLINPETGEEIKINKIESVEILSIPPNVSREELSHLLEPKEFTASMKILDPEVLDMLLGRKTFRGTKEEILKQLTEFLTLEWILKNKLNNIHIFQNKTHKKRRINKKYAKRYGYTCYVYYEGGDLN